MRKNVIIVERDKIDDIVSAFDYGKPVNQGDVGLNTNYGFFEMEFYEGNDRYAFIIIYTIYDGVVIQSMQNGDCFKNDRLEILVYKLFVD